MPTLVRFVFVKRRCGLTKRTVVARSQAYIHYADLYAHVDIDGLKEKIKLLEY